MTNRSPVFTIGHSTLPYGRYLSLLRGAGITVVADVRTSPRSRRFPQYNGEELKQSLRDDGIKYVFLGRELGGRPASPDLFSGGVADYEKMAAADDFQRGLERVLEGSLEHRIALTCSERHPLDCHRCLLVGRELSKRGVQVRHILSDGQIVNQNALEDELLRTYSRSTNLVTLREERLAAAYRTRAREVAYTAPKRKTGSSGGSEDLGDSSCCNDRLYENDSPRLL